MQSGTFIQPGTVVKFVRRGRARRTYYVRVTGRNQLRGTSEQGNVYVTFDGYRVRPDDVSVSFGNWHVYTVREAELETVKAAV